MNSTGTHAAAAVPGEGRAEHISEALDRVCTDVQDARTGRAAAAADGGSGDGIAPVGGSIPTGFRLLDRTLGGGGFEAGRLYVIAGRPGVGKTSLALDMARQMAQAVPVGFFTLEMAADELATRLLASEIGSSYNQLRMGHVTEREYESLVEAKKRLQGLKLFVDDTALMSFDTLCRRTAKLKAGCDLAGVFIDHLQLIEPPKGLDSRHAQLGYLTRHLKALAKGKEIFVAILSQLNRSVDWRPDQLPRLSDLSESGCIEADADAVMFLSKCPTRETRRAAPPRAGLSEKAALILGKNRNGRVGSIGLCFHPRQMRFSEEEPGKADERREVHDDANHAAVTGFHPAAGMADREPTERAIR